MLDNRKERKVTKRDFWRKILQDKEGPKVVEKRGFWGFDKNSTHWYQLFSLEYEIINDCVIICIKFMSRKNLVPELWSKNL